jgi:hypothetical protein
MSKIEVDAIDKQSGSTLTLGGSGTAVTLACGATQTGFGRTGTVDWQTGSIKTATFTAVNGEGYFCNTAGGEFTVNLPAGSAGAIVSIQDYNNTFDSNNLTVDPNGSEKINGGTAGGFVILSTEGEGITLVYIDATVGWRSIQDNVFADTGSNALYVSATGGNTTITEGNFKTHIFTSPGTLCVSSAGNACGTNTVDYFVVAGGGGGGGPYRGSGAGAGGFRLSNSVGCLPAPTMSPLANPTGLPVTATGYPITVGGGGVGSGSHGGSGTTGTSGSNSIFAGSSTITSAGGGGGKSCSTSPGNGVVGGSGGGGGGCSGGSCGGVGNQPPVSPPQGNNGGPSPTNPSFGGGGGGAGAAGTAGRSAGATPAASNNATGGAGSFISDSLFGPTAPSYGTPGPTGSTRYFAGGGSGGNYPTPGPATGGVGGGGEGGGGCSPYTAAGEGTTNTGGGGGGASGPSASPADGGNGGSGIVIIRYKFQ